MLTSESDSQGVKPRKWIDFTRSRSPTPLKRFIATYVLDPEAHLAEPVSFEVLRSARPSTPTLKRSPP